MMVVVLPWRSDKKADLNYMMVVLRAHPRSKRNGGRSQGISSILAGKESSSDLARSSSEPGSGSRQGSGSALGSGSWPGSGRGPGSGSRPGGGSRPGSGSGLGTYYIVLTFVTT